MIDRIATIRGQAALMATKTTGDAKKLAKMVVALCGELDKRRTVTNQIIGRLNDAIVNIDELNERLEAFESGNA